MFTRNSTIRSLSTTTCCSLIHAPFTLWRVLQARAIPRLRASSKLLAEVELISLTRATDLVRLLLAVRTVP
jgi:hypothetical protein